MIFKIEKLNAVIEEISKLEQNQQDLLKIEFETIEIFVYKRKVTFILNGEKVGEARYKKGEALNFPSNLAKYKWFTDKEEKQLFTQQKMGWFGFILYGNNKAGK